MSNALVGQIYSQVMQAVIEASTNDFEEWGVDQATLQALQAIWQQKLSAQRTATFPWDPPPQAAQAAQTAGLQSANSSNANTGLMTPAESVPAPGEIQVKSEPGLEGAAGAQFSSQNGYGSHVPNAQIASQRAAQLLQQQYGTAAHASIGAMQQQGLHLPGRAPAQGGAAPVKQEYGTDGSPNAAASSSVGAAQTDGAGEDDAAAMDAWKAFAAERRAAFQNEQQYAQGMLRAQVDQSTAMTDSGLMMPLDELPKRKKHKSNVQLPTVNEGVASTSTAVAAGTVHIPQMDGADVKDEDGDLDDEDAINSDLDDPDDEPGEEEDDDQEQGETMLCTYDKVQRVKSKWKCVLKDGVLSTGNREYLFHKAQGEFEW